LELRELSLALSTPQGLVLVVGCSHPGIDRILEAAAKIDPRILLVSGGMHMVVSKDDEIAKTINVMQNTYKVAYVAPGHCTGEPAFDAMSKAFGDRYLYAGVGARLMLGAKPQTLFSDGTRPIHPIELSQADRQGYRELAQANDQKRRGLFANLTYADLPNGAYLGQLQRSMMACC
jgi:7,8-dihydropterin-6-yl-methyl-4-(beta-D-ribofuranosyl)aminobenzene 5'-phosphate synthase